MVAYLYKTSDDKWHAFKQKLNKNITIREAFDGMIDGLITGTFELHPERRFDGRRR